MDSAIKKKNKPTKTVGRADADAFMGWLKAGLNPALDVTTQALSFNKLDSMVHFVEEGMILVTPRIFKAFLSQHEFAGKLGVANDPVRALQNQLHKAGHFSKASGSNSFHAYRWKSELNAKPFHACLIPNPSAYVEGEFVTNALLIKVGSKFDVTKSSEPIKSPKDLSERFERASKHSELVIASFVMQNRDAFDKYMASCELDELAQMSCRAWIKGTYQNVCAQRADAASSIDLIDRLLGQLGISDGKLAASFLAIANDGEHRMKQLVRDAFDAETQLLKANKLPPYSKATSTTTN
ncbi:MAG: DNA-binding domain-containing protein [Cytophagales bacterium]|nr:DNA-binding domain-containing protein [Cytophagales bacterium]